MGPLINDGQGKNRGADGTPEKSPLYLLLIHFITINLFLVYCVVDRETNRIGGLMYGRIDHISLDRCWEKNEARYSRVAKRFALSYVLGFSSQYTKPL